MKLGALEAGGTKMVCAIGDETGKIYEQVSIATTTPEETIPKLIAYFQDKQIDGIGNCKFWTGGTGSSIGKIWIYYYHI